jgi:hypothetical protein
MVMSALTPIAATIKGSHRASGEATRAIEKSSQSAPSNGERHSASHEAPKQRPRLQVELVCQAETKSHDPFWDGPRLTPAFVTQLLGQVMTGERHMLVRGAYGAGEAGPAPLLDTRL